MSKIREIDKTSVHRITSGQVVVDLQSCVKELVENSLDAGATSIEIRFKNYGLGSIEAVDNGSGIPEKDHDSIALKYHTSKLSSWSELATIQSFGFRGEALASLCALSTSVIVTTASAPPSGLSLNMDSNGRVREKIRVARQRGTTVSVTNLFSTLPVRRKEFERNVKREYGKALSLLYAYALVPCCGTGVRLTVSNQLLKSPKHVPIQTTGTTSIPTAVRSLWGPTAANNLTELDLSFTVERDKTTFNHSREKKSMDVHVQGLISDFSAGCGRASADRQFIYVNGRPCTMNKLAKAFNEVYRSYSASHVPFLIANLVLPTDAYDVNVTPDKRTIFLHNEANLIGSLKIAIEDRFSSTRSTMPVAIPFSQMAPQDENLNVTSTATQLYSSSVNHSAQSIEISSEGEQSDIVEITSSKGRDSENIIPPPPTSSPHPPPSPHSVHPLGWRAKSDLSHTKDGEGNNQSPERPSSPDLPVVLDSTKASWSPSIFKSNDEQSHKRKRGAQDSDAGYLSDTQHTTHKNCSPDPKFTLDAFFTRDMSLNKPPKKKSSQATHSQERPISPPSRVGKSSSPETRPAKSSRLKSSSERTSSSVVLDLTSEDPVGEEAIISKPGSALADEFTSKLEVVRTIDRGSAAQTVPFDLERVQRIWDHHGVLSTSPMTCARRNGSMDAGLNNLENPDRASNALSRIIEKHDFIQMEILGQFNLGFIITRSRDDRKNPSTGIDDLFIVDQHAADEKYNFETLQQTVHIQSQMLLRPQPLELMATDELLAWEHIDILRQNGFDLKWDDDDAIQPGRRLSLVSHPVSKSTIFDIKDLEEIIHLLHDYIPGQTIRCSKSTAMFASRACRKSVMVGDPLPKPQMSKIIKHMGSMDQPWNCPHGRPTMRHLFDLNTFHRDHKRSINWLNLIQDI